MESEKATVQEKFMLRKFRFFPFIAIMAIMLCARAESAYETGSFLYDHGKLEPSKGFSLVGNSTPVLKEKIELPKSSIYQGTPLVRLSSGSHFTHMGLIQSNGELKKFWGDLENIENKFFGNIPPSPDIDFEKYSIIWFTLAGTNASSAEVLDILEYENAILMKVRVSYSDYGSTYFDLWKIPKTIKPILLQEVYAYDRGRPGV